MADLDEPQEGGSEEGPATDGRDASVDDARRTAATSRGELRAQDTEGERRVEAYSRGWRSPDVVLSIALVGAILVLAGFLTVYYLGESYPAVVLAALIAFILALTAARSLPGRAVFFVKGEFRKEPAAVDVKGYTQDRLAVFFILFVLAYTLLVCGFVVIRPD